MRHGFFEPELSRVKYGMNYNLRMKKKQQQPLCFYYFDMEKLFARSKKLSKNDEEKIILEIIYNSFPSN